MELGEDYKEIFTRGGYSRLRDELVLARFLRGVLGKE